MQNFMQTAIAIVMERSAVSRAVRRAVTREIRIVGVEEQGGQTWDTVVGKQARVVVGGKSGLLLVGREAAVVEGKSGLLLVGGEAAVHRTLHIHNHHRTLHIHTHHKTLHTLRHHMAPTPLDKPLHKPL